jgi:membrane protein DedA with SNARE-associated domain
VSLASITSQVGDHGLVAVFVLMAIAAVIPLGSELVMLYGGAVASGALGSGLGHGIPHGFWSYVAVVAAGVVGNALGAVGGWAIGDYGGRPLLERRGRWLHVSPEQMDRAERWFARFGDRAAAIGFATPIVRSFVAIPAGIFELPLRRLIVSAVAGCTVFCAALAGAGWALGKSYSRVHHDLRYVEIAVVAGVLLLVAYLILRRRRTSRLGRRASDPAR